MGDAAFSTSALSDALDRLGLRGSSLGIMPMANRVEAAETGAILNLGDVQVADGDLIVGDDDGVVVVAAAHEAKVLEIAAEIAEQEASILAGALADGSLRRARQKYGYHILQRHSEVKER